MTTLSLRPVVAVTAVLVVAGLSACSPDAKPPSSPTASTGGAVGPVNAVSASLVGPGCAAYNAEVPSGAGSVPAMAVEQLPSAVSDMPLLKTFSAAISGKFIRKVNLTNRLNRGNYTLFAPVDAAFTRVPDQTLTRWKSDGPLLTGILSHHVVSGQLTRKNVIGIVKSLDGGEIRIRRSRGGLLVNDSHVICGGIRTANATVYLIDRVLRPVRAR
jgi:uncharacterized surface protein with fasciclin (FAS1) repeats